MSDEQSVPDADVRLVAEAFGTQAERNRRNDADHKTFRKRIDGHDAQMLALEKKHSA